MSALSPFIVTAREEGVKIGDLESLPVDRVQELPEIILVNPNVDETCRGSDFYRDFKKCLANNHFLFSIFPKPRTTKTKRAAIAASI